MATARKRAASKSTRSLLAEAVAEEYTKADFLEIIRAAKGAETSAAADCPECGHAMRVKVPDFKKQMELLVSALEQTEGKAAQAVPEATTVIVERPAR